MPELPEVHTFQLYFNEAALNQKIVEIAVSDDYIIKQVGDEKGNTTKRNRRSGYLGERFAEMLKGQTFLSSYRRGKYLFGNLEEGHSVLLHFGMTGDLKLYSNEGDRPKHERFAFVFENGQRLAFEDPRKFGKIRYLENKEAYIAEVGLGEDALLIPERDFLELAQNRKTTIKAFLLNQQILAGVGNLYADEILYQTRIHPASKMYGLSPKQLKTILRKTKDVLRLACERGAYYRDYPEEWFWQWRKLDKVARRGIVERGEVGGRTTYWVTPWQKLYQ